MSAYGTTSRDYLARAQALRASRSPEALLYAALELRCGIEARLHEYLAGAARVATVKKGLWQIRHLSKEVEAVFDAYTTSVLASFIDPETGAKLDVEYTPVTPGLRKIGEMLGNWLHFKPACKGVASDELTAAIDKGIEGLAFATRGTLLGPPAGAGPKKSQMRFMFEEGHMPSFLKNGVDIKVTLKFLVVSKDTERIVLKAI